MLTILVIPTYFLDSNILTIEVRILNDDGFTLTKHSLLPIFTIPFIDEEFLSSLVNKTTVNINYFWNCVTSTQYESFLISVVLSQPNLLTLWEQYSLIKNTIDILTIEEVRTIIVLYKSYTEVRSWAFSSLLNTTHIPYELLNINILVRVIADMRSCPEISFLTESLCTNSVMTINITATCCKYLHSILVDTDI